MKRLTISMSDELFDKLDLIENKSLFIRKLIERELDILDNAPEDNISVPWTERVAILVDDVSTIFSRLELIERKFSGVNNTFENTQTPPDKINIQIPIVDNKIINDDPMLLIANDEEEAYGIISIENGNTETILLPDTQSVTNEKVELIKPVTTNNKQIEQEFAAHAQEMIVDNIPGQKIGPEKMVQYDPEENIHEIKLSKMISEKISKPEQEDVAFGLPGQEPQMQVPDKVTEEKTFAIPELKLPEQEKQETELVMPELKLPEQEKQETELVMPELKLPEQTKQDAEFVMPELKLPEQTKQETEFVMPELKLPEQTKQDAEFVMPELKLPEQTKQETELVMPELKLPEQTKQDAEFVMPVFKLPEQTKQETEFVMPELKLPEQTKQDAEFVMPELKLPEQTKQETEFVMPELKLPEQTKQDAEFVMPDLNVPQIPDTKSSAGIQTFNPWETKTAPELPPFKMPEMQHPGNPGSVPPFINDENCSMQGIQSTPAPTAPVIKQSTDTKPDKLEGNILMYMPRGAKVKKDIIKSLVSRQFSQEEVDRKIKELVAREVLVLKQENGIEHLHRLK